MAPKELKPGIKEGRDGKRDTGTPWPELQTADPVSWDEDPRLFPHPLRSKDAPSSSGCGAEPGTSARSLFPLFSKPKPCRNNFSTANTAWLLLWGQRGELGALPNMFQHAPCLSQPGCAGKVAPKVPRPPCATTATTSPCSGPFMQFWGQGHGHHPKEGNTHIHSGYLLLFPKGKHGWKKTGG